VAYQTAYLKANFPTQYMTAVLIAESGDIDKVPGIIHECERMGIKVLPPNINESFKNFAMVSPDDGTPPYIRFGLSGIKNLGEHIADVVYRERKGNGKYKSLEDFLKRVQDRDLNKKSLESLIKCGALDFFGYDRGTLLGNIENLLNFTRHCQEEKSTSQNSLFAGTGFESISKIRLEPATDALPDEKVLWEKELLGIYVTAHPFGFFEKVMGKTLTAVRDLSGVQRGKWVVVGGVIDSTKKKITRKGAAMMFVKIQDTTSGLELLVFPRTYETTKDVWVEGSTVCVVGKTSEEEGDDKLFVEKAYTLTKENAQQLAAQMSVNAGEPSVRHCAPVSFQSHSNQANAGERVAKVDGIEIVVAPAEIKDKADAIKQLLAKFPGSKKVFLSVGNKKIKTSYSVEPSEDLLKDLRVLVGENNVRV
ncbi:hypothetical protein KKC87_03635, partial [Patescibacteria group bacterium]|nr:hypothetical protein [Patescibacteria group bacterium]